MKQEDWNEFKHQFKTLKPSWENLLLLGFDFVLLILSIKFSFSSNFLLFLLSILMLTLVLLHAYLLNHEATHFALSTNRKLNDIGGHVLGWLVLMPYLPRQRSHLLHHKWTGHPIGDPANRRLIKGFSVMTKAQATRLEYMWKYWIPLLVINDRIGLWRDPFQLYKKGDRSLRIRREILAAYSSLLGYFLFFSVLGISGHLVWFLEWYIPALILDFILEEIANMPHHAEPQLQKETDPALPYWEQYAVTHSCKPTPIWSRFIMLNFNLHISHHLFPWVSWNDLGYVHRQISTKLFEPEIKPETLNELKWAINYRRRPLLSLMGSYFDKLPK